MRATHPLRALFVVGVLVVLCATCSANSVSHTASVGVDRVLTEYLWFYDCAEELRHDFLQDAVSLPQFDPALGVLENVTLSVHVDVTVTTDFYYPHDSAWATMWWYSTAGGSVGGLETTVSTSNTINVIGNGNHSHAFDINAMAVGSTNSGLSAFVGTGSIDVDLLGTHDLCTWWNGYMHEQTATRGTVTATLTYEYAARVPVDIKPGSYPNPLNVRSQGVLTVAVLGNADLDVTQVDPASVELEGVPPLRWGFEDVAAPSAPAGGADGLTDLTLKYSVQDVVSALGAVSDGDARVLVLTGILVDGDRFFGEDTVVILKKGK